MEKYHIYNDFRLRRCGVAVILALGRDFYILPQFGISHLEKHELFGVLNVVSVQSLRFIVKEAVCSQCGYHVHDEVIDRPVA